LVKWALAAAALTVVPAALAAPFAYIANSASNTVTVLDIGAGNQPVATVPVQSRPLGVAVTPDNQEIYVTNYDSSSVSVISAATNQVTHTIANVPGPTGIAVSPDGARIYVSSRLDGAVYAFHRSGKSFIAVQSVGQSPYGLVVSNDGARLFVTNTSGNSVVLNASTLEVIAQVGSFYNVALTPDDNRLYGASLNSDYISAINPASFVQQLPTITGTGGPAGMAVTPDGKHLYAANYSAGTVAAIDLASHAILATIQVGAGPVGLAVTQDGKSVYVAINGENRVAVIDTLTRMVTASIPVGAAPYSLGNFISSHKGAPQFQFAGFFSPVDNAPTVNRMKAGGAVPIKFGLGGDQAMGVMAAGSPSSAQTACPGSAAVDAVEELTSTAGGSSLQYDAATRLYTYVWKTEKGWSGQCRTLSVKLTDGSIRSVVFHFTK